MDHVAQSDFVIPKPRPGPAAPLMDSTALLQACGTRRARRSRSRCSGRDSPGKPAWTWRVT